MLHVGLILQLVLGYCWSAFHGDFAGAEIKLVILLADSKMRRSVPLFAICLLNMKLAAGWFSLSMSS